MIQVIILGYDTLARCGRTIQRFHDETDTAGLDFRITLVDAKYPETGKLPDAFFELATDFQISLITLNCNYGQDGNYNAIKRVMQFHDDDFIVYYDTDVAPKNPAWLKDTLKVFTKADAGFVCMNCSCTDNALANQGESSIIDSVTVREICWPGGWPNGVWRGKFLNTATLHQSHPFYGGSEGNILNALRANDYKGYMLSDHDDARDLTGQEGAYQLWKAEMIVKHDQVDYETWLKAHESARLLEAS